LLKCLPHAGLSQAQGKAVIVVRRPYDRPQLSAARIPFQVRLLPGVIFDRLINLSLNSLKIETGRGLHRRKVDGGFRQPPLQTLSISDILVRRQL
jgi:hypothetical protein